MRQNGRKEEGLSPVNSNITSDPASLADLHRLCREGRLYEVERWIKAGRPLQLDPETKVRRRRGGNTALEIALESGNHSLAELLLRNGYDPNNEFGSPLDGPLRDRRVDLVDLLLEHGADPRDVDLEALFDTYQSGLWERFRILGVDLTAGRVMAYALAHHTSNKPLFGFAKRHREAYPRIQRALNMALGYHVTDANEKGIELSLWAGANPRAPAPSLRYFWRGAPDDDADDEAESQGHFIGFTAIEEACMQGHVAVLQRFKLDPTVDDFEKLYERARDASVIDLLASSGPPPDLGRLIACQLCNLRFRMSSDWSSRYAIEHAVRAGAKWTTSTPEQISAMRSSMRDLSDDTFVHLMKLLAEGDRCSPEILKELARTPLMRARMKKVGFIPDDSTSYSYRPTRSKAVLSKCGIDLPKRKPIVPHTVFIGEGRPGVERLRLDREALFERVWSEPVSSLAREWAISGPGLKKACARMSIPVPPRGYWAKVAGGERPKRPALPTLPAGQAEDIVIALRRVTPS